VSHQLFPLGLKVTGVQITDPTNPSQNRVQFSSAKAEINLSPLLQRKLIIEQLTIQNVVFNQPRTTPGKVYLQPNQQQEGDLGWFPNQQDLPSVDEILAKSPLKTTQAAQALEQGYQIHEAKLKQQYQALPDKKAIAQYQSQLEQLKQIDYQNPAQLLKAKQTFEALKDRLRQHKQALMSFKQTAKQAETTLRPLLNNMREAPKQDYQLLKDLTAGESAAIENLTAALFGEQTRAWSQHLLSAFNLLLPLMQDDQTQSVEANDTLHTSGRWIAFDDNSGLPKVLIREATISFSWQEETLSSEWTNITYQHGILGKPTEFTIRSNNSDYWQQFYLDGQFSLLESGLTANQSWQLIGVELTDVPLVSGNLTSQLSQALLASQGNLSISNGRLSGDTTLNFNELSLDSAGSNKLTNTLATALANLTQLKIHANLAGSIQSPVLSLASDLDKQLGQSLMSSLSQPSQSRLTELQQKLNNKAALPLSSGEGQLAQLLDWQQLATGNLDSIETLLKAQLESAVDNKKESLEDKAKDKLLDKLFGG
jgi:uncharacterized protein (TIGR03545 family)